MKYAYVGYKWNYSRTFGKSSGVADELDRSSTHKFFVAVRLSNSQSSDGDFYIEGQYTGGRNTLQGGTFSLAITRTFNRPW